MRVAVAMSGGMDSTATALILKQEGHDVVGFHMLLHANSDRTWERACMAAEVVGAPIYRVDFRREFADTVIEPFVRTYELGRTPSPCPLCNRFIKMGLLLKHVRGHGCSTLATGHYARILPTPDGLGLFRGVDQSKDQSYFLFMLTRKLLAEVRFPLGGSTKTAVKEFLRQQGVHQWASDESQELCFVPEGTYRAFLEGCGLEFLPGPIMDMKGNVLGRHHGIASYTVGQRRGIGISAREPLYVLAIDAARNALIVGTCREAAVSTFRINDFNSLVPERPLTDEAFLVKVRSTSKPQLCRVIARDEKSWDVHLESAQPGIAPGQAAVLYREDRVIGGGWIEKPFPL